MNFLHLNFMLKLLHVPIAGDYIGSLNYNL